MSKCFVGHEQLFIRREPFAHWHRENFVRTKSITSFGARAGLGQDSRSVSRCRQGAGIWYQIWRATRSGG